MFRISQTNSHNQFFLCFVFFYFLKTNAPSQQKTFSLQYPYSFQSTATTAPHSKNNILHR